MKFVDPTKLYRKSGRMGHPEIYCTFCSGQEMPRFIPRESSTPVNDFKESRMKFAEPIEFNRKSGGAQWICSFFSLPYDDRRCISFLFSRHSSAVISHITDRNRPET
jgi:hypothetical protein